MIMNWGKTSHEGYRSGLFLLDENRNPFFALIAILVISRF